MTKMGYYTAQEVADLLKINKMTLFNWERTSKIPKAKRHPINKWRIYTKEDVEKLRKKIEGRK